jgi:signal transduction histidine kinase
MHLEDCLREGGKPPCKRVPISSKERQRKREILTYLSAASISLDESELREPKQLSRDLILTALVQLGPLRLDCDRAFLSLIDGENQYIVAEATKSCSLTKNTGIYLGVTRLDIDWGVCPNTVKVFTDEVGELAIKEGNIVCDRRRYVIKDFHKESHYRDRPYVKDFPYMRCYAEVPVTTAQGHVIGTYCVVDDRLREFDNAHVISILDEISRCIMDHLDLVKIKQSHVRSDELIKGMSIFLGHENMLNGKTRIDQEQNTILHTREENKKGPKANECDKTVSAERPPISKASSDDTDVTLHTNSTSHSVSTPQSQASDPHTPGTELDSDGGMGLLDSVLETNDAAEGPAQTDSASNHKHGSHSTISYEVLEAFGQAAMLIRESMDMDGMAFLDACTTGFRQRSTASPLMTRAEVDVSESSDDADRAGVSLRNCASLACSVKDDHDSTPSAEPHLTVPESLMERMTRKYPRGAIFSADEYGPILDKSSPHSEISQTDSMESERRRSSRIKLDVNLLFDVLPSARYIIFLPLWHFQNEQWFAGAFGWTNSPIHYFDALDLTYLSTFGNSIMAEVCRFEAIASSRSKSDFISSISHELRSPLHGILASADLLREELDSPQQFSMLGMIDSCGSTLLDTVNHVLEFAKINSQVISSTARGNSPPKTPVLTLTDLGDLVQDVVETVYTGKTSKISLQSDPGAFGSLPPHAVAFSGGAQELPVLVTVGIQSNIDWRIKTDVGAWKRIVMNLFGNSLKYTRSGHIQVNLHLVYDEDDGTSPPRRICFSVRDTGIGMSSDYLKYRLFMPFAQENTFSSGTGLGLSIVKQIVKDLGGDIEVRSRLGVGTTIRVYVPLPPTESHSSEHATTFAVDRANSQPGIFEKLRERSIRYIENPIMQQPNLAPEVADALNERVRVTMALLYEVSSRSLRMTTLSGTSTCDNPDFYFYDASLESEKVTIQLQRLTRLPCWNPKIPLIVLCYDYLTSAERQSQLLANVRLLRPPITPKKLATELLEALDQPAIVPQPAKIEFTNNKALPDSLELPSADANARHTISESVIPTVKALDASEKTTSTKSQMSDLLSQKVIRKPSQHLLLVDDNFINLKILTSLVTRLGCTFESAVNGLEAVQRYKASSKRFDLVFMGEFGAEASS